MENTTDKKGNLSDQRSSKSYETRCNDLAGEFAESLDRFKVAPSDDLSKLRDRIQADLNLADFKFKFRQADHVHHLLYGPYGLQIVTFLLAVAVFWVSHPLTQLKDQETRASLIVKVLEAPPGEGKQLLKLFKDTGILKLDPAQEEELDIALQRTEGPKRP